MVDFSTLEYSELQEKAKELGLPFHRVAKEDLIKSLQEFEAANPNSSEAIDPPDDDEVDDAPNDDATPKDEEVKKESAKTPKVNTVFVHDEAHHVVRTFSDEVHGKDFKDLAHQFATKNGLTYEAKYVAPARICKNCGARMEE